MEDVMPLPVAARPAQLDVGALYRSSRDDVYAYAATLLRDASAAEDATAAAFERALRKRRSYDPRRGSARAWLFAIARNEALDELRRRRRRATLPAEVAEAPGAEEDPAEAAARRLTVRGALAALPAAERELVALRFHAGLDPAEVAAVLGTSPSNVGTRLHRTLEKLRRALDDAG